MGDRAAVLEQQLEQVKAKAREVVLKQKADLDAATAALTQLQAQFAQAQERGKQAEAALSAEKLALKDATDALNAARGQGGASMGELARIGQEREAEKKAALVLAESLATTQKQLAAAQKEAAAAHAARQETERARKEDVDSMRARLEREFGAEKARLNSELEQACAELNAARAADIKNGTQQEAELKAELRSALEQLAAKAGEAEAARQDIVKFKEMVRDQVLALQQERDHALEQVQLMQNQVEADRAAAAAALAKFKEAAREHVHTLQAERDEAVQRAASGSSEVQQQLETFKEQARARFTALQAEKEALAGQVATLHAERDEAVQRAASGSSEVQQHLEAFKEQARARFTALQAEKDALQAERDAAAAQLATVQAERDDAARKCFEMELAGRQLRASFEAELAEKTRVAEQVLAKLAEEQEKNSTMAHAADSMLNKIAAEQERSAALAVELDDVRTKAGKSAAQSAESQRLNELIRQERAEVERLRLEVERAEETVARLAEDRASASLSVTSQVAQRDEELQYERRRAKEAEDEVRTLKADAEAKRMQTRAFVDKLKAELQGEKDQLQRELEQARVELSAALKEIESRARQVSPPPQVAAPVSVAAAEPAAAAAAAAVAGKSSAASRAQQQLEEAKTKAELLMREAVEEAKQARREQEKAKREVLALAKREEAVKGALGRALMKVSPNMDLAVDRFEDALRSCENTVDAALAVLEATRAASAQTPMKRRVTAVRRHATSSMLSAGDEQPQTDEERLMQALVKVENRLDRLTENSRQLLPKVKEVCNAVTQEQPAKGGACDVRRLWATFKGGETKSSYNKVGADEEAAPKYSARIEPEFDEEEQS